MIIFINYTFSVLIVIISFQNVGIDKGDIPDLTKAPSSLLDALEQHFNHMEGKKSSTTSATHASR